MRSHNSKTMLPPKAPDKHEYSVWVKCVHNWVRYNYQTEKWEDNYRSKNVSVPVWHYPNPVAREIPLEDEIHEIVTQTMQYGPEDVKSSVQKIMQAIEKRKS